MHVCQRHEEEEREGCNWERIERAALRRRARTRLSAATGKELKGADGFPSEEGGEDPAGCNWERIESRGWVNLGVEEPFGLQLGKN